VGLAELNLHDVGDRGTYGHAEAHLQEPGFKTIKEQVEILPLHYEHGIITIVDQPNADIARANVLPD
jgi:hypothetical protein